MMIASMFAIGVAQAATFADVRPTDWSYPYVEDLAAKGILDTTKTNYEPGRPVNRAEMAKLAVEAWGLTLETPTVAPFKDVALGAWYTPYIYTAKKNNIIGGYKDSEGNLTGYFGPGDQLQRDQAMKIVTLAANLTTNVKGGPHFSDVPTTNWAYEYIETGYNWSVIDGYPGTSLFKPGEKVLRDQIAKIVSNAMNPTPRPGAGFNIEDAYATSLTAVHVCFNEDVGTGADVAANYSVKDSDGHVLAVSKAVKATDPKCVDLTTASQTEGKNYDLVVSGVKSAAGEELDIADISFTGYSAVGTGGDLTCSAGTQPASVSVPKGSTGISFTVVNCQASSDPVVINSMTFHRFGAGSQSDFANVYLYQGNNRLTTGRSINSETQTVEFTGLNYEVGTAGVSFVVVGDIATGASAASQHGFEIVSKDAISSNAQSITGTFPIQGNLMTISGATAGSVTIAKNGTLDEVVIGTADARLAQFQLEASGSEAMKFNRIALYMRGTCRSNDISNLKLYAEGSNDVLASTNSVGAKDLATFVLDTPYNIAQGGKKIFYVTGDVTCRNGETIKTYLDQTTDLYVTGVTYGTGAAVTNNYDGTGTQYSEVTIKGSDFNVSSNGPAARDVAVGQSDVSCLDMTISNASGQDLEIRDWKVKLDVVSPATPSAAGGLIDTSTTTANYSLIKLVKYNADGTIGGTLLGPTELSTSGSDTSQTLTLSGSNTIYANQTVKAGITLKVANNNAISGDVVRCTLVDLTSLSNAVRDQNGDALGASAITPSSDIVGNNMTMTKAALTVSVAANPTSATFVRGTNDASLLGLSLKSGSSLDNTIKSLSITGAVDLPPVSAFTTPADGSTNVKDVVQSLALYDGTTMVSGTAKNLDSTSGKVTFNNLNIKVLKGETKLLTLKGNISNAAPNNVRVKFGITSASDVSAIDQNGESVSGIDVTQALNCTGVACAFTDDSGVRMTVVTSGTPAVSQSGSAEGMLLAGEATSVQLAKMKFTMTTASGVLNDFSLGVLGDPTSLAKVYIYDSACATKLGSATGYNVTNKAVEITSANINLPVGDTTLCFMGDIASVKNDPADPSGQTPSGAYTGLYLRDITKLTSGGVEVAPTANSTVIGGGITTNADMTNSQTHVCTTLNPGLSVGDVVVIDNELMFVDAASMGAPTANCTAGFDTGVSRGTAGTVATTHTAGAEVRLSKFGIPSGVLSVKKGDLVLTSTGAGNLNYYLALVDNPAGEACGVNTNVSCVYNTTAAFVAGNVAARFNLHGNYSIVRKIKPTLAVNASPASGSSLASNSQFELMGVDITAVGKGSLELTPANLNTVSFTVTGTGIAAAGAGNYCAIYDRASGTKLSSANIAGTMTFTMGTTAGDDTSGITSSATGLTVNAGTTATIVLKCTTASATGSSASATMTGMTYGDGTVGNGNVNDGSLIQAKFPLSGPNFTQP